MVVLRVVPKFNMFIVFFSEKRLRSLSINGLSYALTTPSTYPSHNSQSIPSASCYLQECGCTLLLCTVTICHILELTVSLKRTCLSLVTSLVMWIMLMQVQNCTSHYWYYKVGDQVLLGQVGILRKSESCYECDLWTIRSVHTNGTIRV